MTRPRTLHAGLGALAVAGAALSGAVGTASARITVLDDDAATIARAIAPRPGGASGLRLDDNLNQLPSTPAVLPFSRQAARVSGGAPTASTPSILGRGPAGMASLLRERVRTSGVHRVFVDDVGAAFAGDEGDDLAAALEILAKERPSYAPVGVSRRVHLYVSSPGRLLADPGWAGARTALARSGGVWLKTFAGETTWAPAEWLAWPSESVAQMSGSASLAARVHVVFSGGGSQSAAWSLARAGSACAVLGNGPGGYRLGDDVDDFVAEYRRSLPITTTTKQPVTGCTGVPTLSAAGARGLDAAADLE